MLNPSIYLNNLDQDLAGYLNFCVKNRIDYELGLSEQKKVEIRNLMKVFPKELLDNFLNRNFIEPGGPHHPGSIKIPPPGRFYNHNGDITRIGTVPFDEQIALSKACDLSFIIDYDQPPETGKEPVFKIDITLNSNSPFSLVEIIEEDIFFKIGLKDRLFRLIIDQNPTETPNRRLTENNIKKNPHFVSFAPWGTVWVTETMGPMRTAQIVLENGRYFHRHQLGKKFP